MMRSPARRLMLAAASAAALAVPLLAGPMSIPAAAAAGSGPAFIHGVLPPPPAGSTSMNNQAAEPQIRSDPAGTFYISSENGLGSGTDAWSSTDGGHSYGSSAPANAPSAFSAESAICPCVNAERTITRGSRRVIVGWMADG